MLIILVFEKIGFYWAWVGVCKVCECLQPWGIENLLILVWDPIEHVLLCARLQWFWNYNKYVKYKLKRAYFEVHKKNLALLTESFHYYFIVFCTQIMFHCVLDIKWTNLTHIIGVKSNHKIKFVYTTILRNLTRNLMKEGTLLGKKIRIR